MTDTTMGSTTEGTTGAGTQGNNRADEHRSLRDALGQYATGVVLVAATARGRRCGMVVSSFTSVSLDPPLVSFCAGHASTTWPQLRAAGAFAISVLGAGHEPLCRTFTTRAVDRFSGADWAISPGGHPLVPDAIGWFDCGIEEIRPAGDHTLVLARVLRWSTRDRRDPLVFHAGSFTRLVEVRDGPVTT